MLLSFSQWYNLFRKCPRWWWYEKVLKVPYVSDMSYAKAGNCVHHALEKYYSRKITDINLLKDSFNEEWKKEKLNISMLSMRDSEYWLMVIEGVNLAIVSTTQELQIFFADYFNGYLDLVNTNTDEIGDWKSSKRDEEHDNEYRKQLTLYSVMYKKKFDRDVKKCTVYYLKFTGSKQKYEFIPTEEEKEKIKLEFEQAAKEMEELKKINIIPAKCEVCDPWCPYKDICNDDILVFNIHILGNFVRLDGVIPSLLDKGLTRKFSYELKDAFFIKQRNPYINTTVKFWSIKNRLLPLGMLEGLKKTLNDFAEFNKKEIKINITDERKFNTEKIVMPDKFINDKNLRDYQIEAVESFIKNKYGVIEAGCGSGKTEIACEIIRQLNTRTLILVHTKELLNQTIKRLKDNLGIEVGKIGEGIEDIKFITVATMQSINKNIKKHKDYLASINLVVFDEAHHLPAKTLWRISRYILNSTYSLGLTATKFRDDGNDMYINAITGETIYKINSKDLIEKNYLVEPQIIFIKDIMLDEEIKKMEEECKTGLINETKNYNIYYDKFVIKNEKRNNIIKNICETNKNKRILLLAKSVEHGRFLAELLNGKHIHGELDKKSREEILEDFKNNKINILVATLSIFSEGIDLPFLEILINCSANSGDVKSLQMVGRIMRQYEGKNNCIFYDFVDEPWFFKRASNKRIRIFRKEGYTVDFIDSKGLNIT